MAAACLAMAVGCVAPTAPTPVQGPWVTYRAGDNNAANNANETHLATTNVGRLRQAWTFLKPGSLGSAASPLVSGSTVVDSTYQPAADSRSAPIGRVVALQLATGKVLWSRSFPRGASVDAIWQGVVVVTLTQTYNDPSGEWPHPELVGFSLATGATLWADKSTDDTLGWGGAFSGGGKLFISGPHGTGALNVTTGTAGKVFSWFPQRGAAYAGGRIFTVDGTSLPLISYDATSGQAINQYSVTPGDDGWNEPIADGKRIYVATALSGQPSGKAEVAAFSENGCAATFCGASWKTFLPETIRSAMTIDQGRIFAVGVYGSIYALDADTGKVLWTGHEPTSTADLSSANGVLYVLNTSDQLYAYGESGCGSQTCAPLAVIDDPTPAHGVSIFPPVVADGYVLYANANGLRALTVS